MLLSVTSMNKEDQTMSQSSNLQCSWFKRLYEDFFHSWKGIPLFLIKNHPEKISQFHSNLSIK